MPYPIRKVGKSDLDQFLAAMSIPFGTDPSPANTARFQIALEQADLAASFDDDQLVATFGSYDLNLTVPGGNIVPTAGTTLVTVLPTHRRQGILRSHMVRHFQESREKGQAIAALWASESNIYGRFGYGPAAENINAKIEKPYAILRDPVDTRGKMRLLDLDEALRVFPRVYDRVAKNRPGMFARTPAWWKLRNLADPEPLRKGGSAHRRVLFEQDGEPAGYAIYRSVVNHAEITAELRIIELIGQDANAERALWQYLFGVDLISTITHWNLKPDDPLPWWLEQPRELERKPIDSIWVRPVNLVEALNLRRYSTAGKIVFRFRDEYCAWNNGTYVLNSTSDGEGRCEKTEATPELELTPFTLGAIYLGGHRAGTLASAGLITGNPQSIAQADALFAAPQAPWCQEIF